MNKETIINTNLSLIQALLTSQGAEFLTEVEEDGRPVLNGRPTATITLESSERPGAVEPSSLVHGLAGKLGAMNLGVTAEPDRDNSYCLIIEGEGLASPKLSQLLLAEIRKNVSVKQSLAASHGPRKGRA